MKIFSFLFLLLIALGKIYASVELTSPPPNLPIPIKMHVHFLNFNSLDEKEELFNADFYFVYKWQDPRLAFERRASNDMQVYFDEAVIDKFKTIWWPQFEYLNAKEIKINNQTLFIFPDGNIHYYVSLQGDFYSSFNLERFPFDTQILHLDITSFLWADNIVYFEIEKPMEYDETANRDQEEFKIIGLEEKIIKRSGLAVPYFGPPGDFSIYQFSLTIKREWTVVVSQVFVPLLLTIFICCSVFLGFKESYLDQIMMILTCSLVVVAIKFTIDSSLPTIANLTVIDRAFTTSYFFFAFCIFGTILEKHFLSKRPKLTKKLNHLFLWLIPLLFIISMVILVLVSS